ncbi:branched-chain amino acid ABC transporter permease [Variovorax sp. M-6]|uniref:branched-chain amino acid ABC transporter permease n=1 Tax=Variovorax sp. M-6 TaxID=3233041 RepID=UPI003F97EBD0
MFLQLFANGLQLGALYALTAVGFSLIFGSTRIFHFAHGATLTIAGYVFHFLYTTADLHWAPAVAGSTAAAVVFGVLLDRLVYAPIQRHEGSFFTVFVAAFGVGIVVQNVIGMIFGRAFISVSTPLSRGVDIGAGLIVSPLTGLSILCGIGFFVGLQLFLMRTHVGMALRALSDNPDLVRAYGMSPRRLSTIVFALGSLLVVPAAILTAASSGLNPAMGHHLMLISLAATIVGGIGSLRGAACAGLLLGLAESLALWLFAPQWSEAVTFIVLFLFIMFRPSGFFGRAITS